MRRATLATAIAGLALTGALAAAPGEQPRVQAPGGQFDPALAYGSHCARGHRENGCALNTLAVWDDQRGGNSIFGGA